MELGPEEVEGAEANKRARHSEAEDVSGGVPVAVHIKAPIFCVFTSIYLSFLTWNKLGICMF